jgi:hypothetical protein
MKSAIYFHHILLTVIVRGIIVTTVITNDHNSTLIGDGRNGERGFPSYLKKQGAKGFLQSQIMKECDHKIGYFSSGFPAPIVIPAFFTK